MANVKRDLETESPAAETLAAPEPRPYTSPALRHLGSVRELTLKTGPLADLPTKKASTRELKTDIQYLSDADRHEVANHVLGLKLASYFYKPEANESAGRQLGFILEDAPGAPFSIAEEKVVNLYGFASAIAAVVQEQQVTIKRLEAELVSLRSDLTKKS